MSRKMWYSLLAVLILTATVLSACGGSTSTTSSTSAPVKIAILLPENHTPRYETQDLPNFKAELTAKGYDVSNLIYSNANQDAPTQQSQAEAALTNGAKVLVLDPVDSAAAAAIADAAAKQNVPVISYDRLITGSKNVNYYISFDNVQVGKLQATTLMAALSGVTNPTIVEINGDPADHNASLFKQGAHSVFDPLVSAGKLTIGKEYDTPGWDGTKAQDEMTQALTALNNKVDGVLSANDTLAAGAYAAMKAAGISTPVPLTGQDATVGGIQNIISGIQTMTVYKAIKPEAVAAADLAFDLATGVAVPSTMTNGATVNNGVVDVPSILLTPVAVTKDNVETTVIADGFWKVSDICTADFAAACAAAGVK